jgi:hypothetical protein
LVDISVLGVEIVDAKKVWPDAADKIELKFDKLSINGKDISFDSNSWGYKSGSNSLSAELYNSNYSSNQLINPSLGTFSTVDFIYSKRNRC